jgi:hypothetical protein
MQTILAQLDTVVQSRTDVASLRHLDTLRPFTTSTDAQQLEHYASPMLDAGLYRTHKGT